MGNVVQNVTATTAADELQTRNGLEHQRVYDPDSSKLLKEILYELKLNNHYLAVVTGLDREEVENDIR